MSANAPKVLLRSEESGGHVAIVELGGGGDRRSIAMDSTRRSTSSKAS